MRISLAILLVVAALAGCSRQEAGVYAAKGRDRLIADMKPEAVIVKVNGVSFTKAEWQTYRELLDKVFRLHSAIALDKVSEKAARYLERQEPKIHEEWIRRELMHQEFVRAGLEFDTNLLAQAEQRFLRFARCRKGETIDDLALRLGPAAGALMRERLRNDVEGDILRQSVTTNDLQTVSDEDISKELELVSEFNARAKKLNAKQRAKAEKARQRILAGEKFADVAAEVAEVHPEYGKAWEEFFEAEEFPEGTDMRAWLPKSQIGDISGPLDLDDGLAIVGVLWKGDGEVPAGMKVPTLYKLVRCTFKAFEEMAVPSTNELRTIILQERRAKVQQELGSRLFDSARIEFPNGQAFFKEKTVEAKVNGPVGPQPSRKEESNEQ